MNSAGGIILIISFAINPLSEFNREFNNVLFPPGEAQTSNAINGLLKLTQEFKAYSINIDPAS